MRHLNAICLKTSLAVILFSAGCSNQERETSRFAWISRVDSIAGAAINDHRCPGISVTIMQGDEFVLTKGYGWADAEDSVRATAETRYPVASISKQFTATAIMKLVEQGRLSLDDPVARYLPEFKDSTSQLRISHLLRQTSGISGNTTSPEVAALHQKGESNSIDFALQPAVSVLGKWERLYAPGYWWSYSNSNYLLLAAIIERVTGSSFSDFMMHALFEPLQLHSTYVCGFPGNDSSPEASGYREEKGVMVRALPFIKTPKGVIFPDPGSGGICSSTHDLAVWMRALVQGKIISSRSFDEMTRSAAVDAGFTPPYGFGFSMTPVAGESAIWHTGFHLGTTSALVYLPDRDIIIALVANKAFAMVPSFVTAIVRAMLNLPNPEIVDREISEEEAARIVGTYNDYIFRIEVFLDSGHLQVHVPRMGMSLPLMWQGGNEFLTSDPPGFRFRFEPDDQKAGRVVFNWFEIQSYGRRMEKP